jgi:hypothetical protein
MLAYFSRRVEKHRRLVGVLDRSESDVLRRSEQAGEPANQEAHSSCATIDC